CGGRGTLHPSPCMAIFTTPREVLMSNLSALIEQYLAGAAELRAAVQGMSRQQLLARPIEGKMSTLEVVCHLADFDPIIADRMKRVIAEDNPTLVGADENRFRTALAYHDRDVEEELAIVERTRSQMARILRAVPAAALQRVGNHTERGARTLEQLLTGAINHIPHHVRYIHDKRMALGLKKRPRQHEATYSMVDRPGD